MSAFLFSLPHVYYMFAHIIHLLLTRIQYNEPIPSKKSGIPVSSVVSCMYTACIVYPSLVQ